MNELGIERYKTAHSGFTLVELVTGIVVMAIALTFMMNVFFSNPGRSVEPILQIRAAEFGQALMDEILAKNFDQTTPVGGLPACSNVTTPCTTIGNIGPDGENRSVFNDVDDYNDYCTDDEPGKPGWPVTDSFGDVPDEFKNFRMRICVGYDGDFNGFLNEGGLSDQKAKLIIVDVYAPQVGGLGSEITFKAYKGNY